MNWLNWLNELGISLPIDSPKPGQRSPIKRGFVALPTGSQIVNTIRLLYEQELMQAGQDRDFRLEENESLSVWVWNPRGSHSEEELDALFDEWAFSIRTMGYVEKLNDQQELSEGGDQKIRYRRYLKPSLRTSNKEEGRQRHNFGNVMLEMLKTRGITEQFRVQLTRYPGRNVEENAQMASFMEQVLSEK